MKATDWFTPYEATEAARKLTARARDEGLFYDVRSDSDLTKLRDEVRRLAGDMDNP